MRKYYYLHLCPQVQDRYDNVETGSTFILVDIYYLDANRQRTSTHNWHVHSLPAVPEQECTGVIGGHYNPFSVSLGKSGFSRLTAISVDF